MQVEGQTGGVTYSIVPGGMAGTGPRFVNAAAGDFRVRWFSPAIDAGSNNLVPTGILTDLAGASRFADQPKVVDKGVGTGPIVDIGAFEVNVALRPLVVQ